MAKAEGRGPLIPLTGIKGSVERAVPDGGKSLADNAALEGLVRDLVGGIWQRAARAGKGEGYTGEDAAKEDQAAAQTFIKIVSGEDPAWTPQPGWTPNDQKGMMRGKLNDYLVSALDQVCSPALLAKPNGGIQGLAVYIVGQTYSQIGEASGLTEDDLRGSIDSLVEEAVHMLLGLPLSE